jgi:hypothetical protein
MDQNNPTNTSWGTGATSDIGGGASLGSNTDTGLGSGTSAGGFGVSSATDTGLCPTCGQSVRGGGLEQFLGRLGINDEMIGNLKTQFQNVDIDEYLNTARDYLKDGGAKAQSYAKEHPGKVAAGVATLALGAGLLFAALNRDRS